MKGSEKQVVWAEKIKKGWVDSLVILRDWAQSEAGINWLIKYEGTSEQAKITAHKIADAGLRAITSTLDLIGTIDSASWFIDHRGRTPLREAGIKALSDEELGYSHLVAEYEVWARVN